MTAGKRMRRLFSVRLFTNGRVTPPVAKRPPAVGANYGAPPRLRLMERGMSLTEAAAFADAINRGAREGLSYEAATARALEALRQLRQPAD